MEWNMQDEGNEEYTGGNLESQSEASDSPQQHRNLFSGMNVTRNNDQSAENFAPSPPKWHLPGFSPDSSVIRRAYNAIKHSTRDPFAKGQGFTDYNIFYDEDNTRDDFLQKLRRITGLDFNFTGEDIKKRGFIAMVVTWLLPREEVHINPVNYFVNCIVDRDSFWVIRKDVMEIILKMPVDLNEDNIYTSVTNFDDSRLDEYSSKHPDERTGEDNSFLFAAMEIYSQVVYAKVAAKILQDVATKVTQTFDTIVSEFRYAELRIINSEPKGDDQSHAANFKVIYEHLKTIQPNSIVMRVLLHIAIKMFAPLAIETIVAGFPKQTSTVQIPVNPNGNVSQAQLVNVRGEVIQVFQDIANNVGIDSGTEIARQAIQRLMPVFVDDPEKNDVTQEERGQIPRSSNPVSPVLQTFQTALQQQQRDIENYARVLSSKEWATFLQTIVNHAWDIPNVDVAKTKVGVELGRFVGYTRGNVGDWFTNTIATHREQLTNIATQHVMAVSGIAANHAEALQTIRSNLVTQAKTAADEWKKNYSTALSLVKEKADVTINVGLTTNMKKIQGDIVNANVELTKLNLELENAKKDRESAIAAGEEARKVAEKKKRLFNEYLSEYDHVSTLNAFLIGAGKDLKLESDDFMATAKTRITSVLNGYTTFLEGSGTYVDVLPEAVDFYVSLLRDYMTHMTSINSAIDAKKEELAKTKAEEVRAQIGIIVTGQIPGLVKLIGEKVDPVLNKKGTGVIDTKTQEAVVKIEKRVEEKLAEKTLGVIDRRTTQAVSAIEGKLSEKFNAEYAKSLAEQQAKAYNKKFSDELETRYKKSVEKAEKDFAEKKKVAMKKIVDESVILTDAISKHTGVVNEFVGETSTLEEKFRQVQVLVDKAMLDFATKQREYTTEKTAVSNIVNAAIADMARMRITMKTARDDIEDIAGKLDSSASPDVIRSAVTNALYGKTPLGGFRGENAIDTFTEEQVGFLVELVTIELAKRKSFETQTNEIKKGLAVELNDISTRVEQFRDIFDGDTIDAANAIIKDAIDNRKMKQIQKELPGDTALSLGILKVHLQNYKTLDNEIMSMKASALTNANGIAELQEKNRELETERMGIKQALAELTRKQTSDDIMRLTDINKNVELLTKLQAKQASTLDGLGALREVVNNGSMMTSEQIIGLRRGLVEIEEKLAKTTAENKTTVDNAVEGMVVDIDALKTQMKVFLEDEVKKDEEREKKFTELETRKKEDIEKRDSLEKKLALLQEKVSDNQVQNAKTIANAIDGVKVSIAEVDKKIPENLKLDWGTKFADLQTQISAIEVKYVKEQKSGKSSDDAVKELTELKDKLLAEAKKTIELDVQGELKKKKKELDDNAKDIARAKVLLSDLELSNKKAVENAANAQKSADAAAATVTTLETRLADALIELSNATTSGKEDIKQEANTKLEEIRKELADKKVSAEAEKHKADEVAEAAEKAKKEVDTKETDLRKKQEADAQLQKQKAALEKLSKELTSAATKNFEELKADALKEITALVDVASKKLDDSAESVKKASVDTSKINEEIGVIREDIEKIDRFLIEMQGNIEGLLEMQMVTRGNLDATNLNLQLLTGKTDTNTKDITLIKERLNALEEIRESINSPEKVIDTDVLGDLVTKVMVETPEVWQGEVEAYVTKVTGKFEGRVEKVEEGLRVVAKEVEGIKPIVAESAEEIKGLKAREEEAAKKKEKEKEAKEKKEKEEEEEKKPMSDRVAEKAKEFFGMPGNQKSESPQQSVGERPSGGAPVPPKPFHIYDKHRFESYKEEFETRKRVDSAGYEYFFTMVSMKPESYIFPVYDLDPVKNEKILVELELYMGEKKWKKFCEELRVKFAAKNEFILGSRGVQLSGAIDMLREALGKMTNLKRLIIPFDNDPTGKDGVSDGVLNTVLWTNESLNWKNDITMLVARLPQTSRGTMGNNGAYLFQYQNVTTAIFYVDFGMFNVVWPITQTQKHALTMHFTQRMYPNELSGAATNIDEKKVLTAGSKVYVWPKWSNSATDEYMVKCLQITENIGEARREFFDMQGKILDTEEKKL